MTRADIIEAREYVARAQRHRPVRPTRNASRYVAVDVLGWALHLLSRAGSELTAQGRVSPKTEHMIEEFFG